MIQIQFLVAHISAHIKLSHWVWGHYNYYDYDDFSLGAGDSSDLSNGAWVVSESAFFFMQMSTLYKMSSRLKRL